MSRARTGCRDLIRHCVVRPYRRSADLAVVTVARIIDAVPQPWLVGVELYRALGVTSYPLRQRQTAWSVAWPAGVGDIAIGLVSPSSVPPMRRAATIGDSYGPNVLDILDLIIAVTTGFLSLPSWLQPFVVEPENELMTILPMVLIPTYLGPLSILLHFASLAKLPKTKRADVPAARLLPVD